MDDGYWTLVLSRGALQSPVSSPSLRLVCIYSMGRRSSAVTCKSGDWTGTLPVLQKRVARAFNARLKLKMDEAGIEIPLPQMQLHTSPTERDWWPRTGDHAEGENRQAMDGSSAPGRRPDMAVASKLDVLKGPTVTEAPEGPTGLTSSAGSPGKLRVRRIRLVDG